MARSAYSTGEDTSRATCQRRLLHSINLVGLSAPSSRPCPACLHLVATAPPLQHNITTPHHQLPLAKAQITSSSAGASRPQNFLTWFFQGVLTSRRRRPLQQPSRRSHRHRPFRGSFAAYREVLATYLSTASRAKSVRPFTRVLLRPRRLLVRQVFCPRSQRPGREIRTTHRRPSTSSRYVLPAVLDCIRDARILA